MRNISTSLVLAVGLMSSVALAQTTVPGEMPAKVMKNASDALANGQMMASDYIDRNVYGQGDQTIGEVKDLVLDTSTGMITSVVIGVGGFLGMGEKDVAIPFAQIKPGTKDGKLWLSIASTKEELKAAPDFNRKSALNSKPALPPMTPTAPSALSADANRTPPLPGANSFTEAQVRSRLEGMGYSGITGLAKDDQSIWRGAAMKDGKNVNVAVDFKGNVVAQ